MESHAASEPSKGRPKGVKPFLHDWPDRDRARLDADLRVVLDLIDRKHVRELAFRTGIVVADPKTEANAQPRSLSLVVHIAAPRRSLRWTAADLQAQFGKLGLRVASVVLAEVARTKQGLRRIPAWIEVDAYDPSLLANERRDSRKTLVATLKQVLELPFVDRIALSGQALPALQLDGDALTQPAALVGLPLDRIHSSATKGKSKAVTGAGVIIGIIDDGCPFAHQDFLVRKGSASKPRYDARVAMLWDQNPVTPDTVTGNGWISDPAKTPGYGRMIDAAAIEDAIKKRIKPRGEIDEQAVYDDLGYPLGKGERASHGSRVAGIAAGNGRSVVGREGIAPKAEIVFVQLPQVLARFNPAALDKYVMEALAFIFDYAASRKKRAVVNLSYGNYKGAHDGTGPVETFIEAQLALANRAVVVSAGNGFEADCHARARLVPGATVSWDWIVPFDDPSPNEVEIWYPKGAPLAVSLTAPDGAVYGPYVAPVFNQPIVDGNGSIQGYADHTDQDNGDRRALFSLLANAAPPPAPAAFAPPPDGVWRIGIRNAGNVDADVHAWIRRDDVGPTGRRAQSRFSSDHSDPTFTIDDYACGKRTIAIGAWNPSTREVAQYSASGPLRVASTPPYSKPLAVAPGEAAPHGRGVLGTASAAAQPRRIAGTSAAAPFVAGAIALAYEFAATAGVKNVSIDMLMDAIHAAASAQGLDPNLRQQAARYPLVKQDAVMQYVVGAGALGPRELLQQLFP